MNSEATRGSGRTWLFLVVGGLIGLGIGIVVSATTAVLFAPEIGFVVGQADREGTGGGVVRRRREEK